MTSVTLSPRDRLYHLLPFSSQTPAMATRRSTRLTATKPEGKRGVSEETWDRCAACKPDSTVSSKAKTVWAECEACGTWFHWDCVGEGGDINRVDKWWVRLKIVLKAALGVCSCTFEVSALFVVQSCLDLPFTTNLASSLRI